MPRSKDFLSKVFLKVERIGSVDEKLELYIDSIFPGKVAKVLEILDKGITKCIFLPSNREIWVVTGKNDEYMIYPKIFCSCYDFYKNACLLKKRPFCKHLLAQVILEAFRVYDVLELQDEEFQSFLKELSMNL